MRWCAPLLPLLLFSPLAGCAQVVGIEEPVLEGFGCLGEPRPDIEDETLELTGTVIDIVGGVALQGIEVAACEFFDANCESPPATDTSDADGKVELSIPLSSSGPQGFNGLLRISGTGRRVADDETVEITTTYWRFSNRLRPDDGGNQVALRFEVGSDADLTTLLSPQGVTREAGRGLVTFEVRDCDGSPVRDAVVSLEDSVEGARVFYVTEDLPFDATAEATNASGRGGIFTLPTGRHRVSVEVDGYPIVDEVSFRVFDDQLTFLRLDPRIEG